MLCEEHDFPGKKEKSCHRFSGKRPLMFPGEGKEKATPGKREDAVQIGFGTSLESVGKGFPTSKELALKDPGNHLVTTTRGKGGISRDPTQKKRRGNPLTPNGEKEKGFFPLSHPKTRVLQLLTEIAD